MTIEINIAMTSPFDTDDLAFEPFYDTDIEIRGCGQTTTIKACVFDQYFDDPLCDLSPSADREYISVVVPKSGKNGWNLTTPPKREDVVIMKSNMNANGQKTYAVENVIDFMDNWILKAREVEVQ